MPHVSPTARTLSKVRVIIPEKAPRRFYGYGIPGVEVDKLAGRLKARGLPASVVAAE